MDINETEITAFTCYSSPAGSHDVRRPSGGIVIAISKNIQSSSCIIFRSQHVLIVKVKNCKMNFLVSYFQPCTKLYHVIFDISERLSRINKEEFTIIAGDFNCRLDRGERGTDLLDILWELGFACLNSSQAPTYYCHKGRSAIDLVFTNNLKHTSDNVTITENSATKHCTVGFKVHTDVERADSKTAHIRKTDLEKLEYKLKILSTPCVESLNRWYRNFISAFRESVPAAKKRISKIWFDRSCNLLHAKVKKQWDLCRGQENK